MAVNKVTMNTPDGEQTLIDLTGDSVTPETLAKGATAHNAAGEQIVGTMPTTAVLYTEQTLTEAQMAQARQNIGLGGVPDYWRSALDAGVEAINTALCTAGMNKSAFLFYSDSHWNSGSKMAPTLLKYLYRHTGMTRTFFGGDIVNDEASDYDTMKYLWDWRNQLKDLPNHHSVVGNHDDGNATNNLFSEQYIYGYMFAAEETSDVVRGGVTWYYIDSGSEKTRYIFLDTAYKGMNSDQTAFLKDSLKSTPDGWHIVVVAHIWYMPDYDQYDVKPIPIIGLSSAAATVGTILDKYNSRNDEFSSCAAKVEFCIGGHAHIDYTGATTGGIPIILVETDSHHTRSGLSCLIGTPTESSVNGIIADYNTNKVNVVRIGRGNSFIVDLTTGESEVVPDDPTAYTNILKDPSIGYQLNREVSTTNYEERDSSAGYDLTGYIPVKYGDIIYLKNVTMPDGVTDRRNTIYYYDTNKVWVGSLCCTTTASYNWNPIFENGNLVQFTNKQTGYIRINAEDINDTSIITINEPIIEESAYINQIPISTDTDGSIYNGTGYKVGCRINSSGVLKEGETNYAVTGFIPFKFYDIAYISADVFEGNKGNCVVSAFNAEKTFRTSAYVNNSYGIITIDDKGNYVFDPTKATSGIANWQTAAFIRVTGVSTMSDASIITVNEPIE